MVFYGENLHYGGFSSFISFMEMHSHGSSEDHLYHASLGECGGAVNVVERWMWKSAGCGGADCGVDIDMRDGGAAQTLSWAEATG